MITPTHAVVIVFLSWMLLCLIRIWSFTPGQGRFGVLVSVVLRITGGVLRVLYGFFGLYLLDIVARICFLDMFSYGRFGYIATPILLCLVVGTLYIVSSTFVAPSWATLLAFGGMATTYLYMTTMIASPELRISLYVGISLSLFFSFIELFRAAMKWGATHRRSETREAGSLHEEASSNGLIFFRPIWDLSCQFRFLESAKGYALVFIVISIEFVLQFEGMSLLYWL